MIGYRIPSCGFRGLAAVLIAGLILLSGCAAGSHRSRVTPVYYPPPPSVPRVVFVGDLADLQFKSRDRSAMERFLFGPSDTTGGRIGKPFGMAFSGQGLFVCDTRAGLVHVFDFDTGRHRTLGASGPGRLLKPLAVDVTTNGPSYVADPDLGEVTVYDTSGDVVAALPPRRPEPFEPVDVATAGGAVYVVNRAMRRVEVLDPETGSVVRVVGEGRLSLPSGIAVDDRGHVFVSDVMQCRVHEYDDTGAFVRYIGRPGDRAGEFARPKHLAVGPDGILFVVDAGFQRVEMFDRQGRCLMLFGGPGDGPGCLSVPAGVAIAPASVPSLQERVPDGFETKYFIFVSDQFGPWRVRVYAFGRGVR